MPPPAAPDTAVGDATPSLEDASARLESALARLEALVDAGPFQSELFRAEAQASQPQGASHALRTEALRTELERARARERALEAAAAAASEALGRAMTQVRHALAVDGSAAADDPEADEALDPAGATEEDAEP